MPDLSEIGELQERERLAAHVAKLRGAIKAAHRHASDALQHNRIIAADRWLTQAAKLEDELDGLIGKRKEKP